MYPSIYNSFQVIRTTIAKKSPFLRTPAFIFCLPWGRLCGNHAKHCMNEKTIHCLPNPSQHVPIYLQQFPSYTMLKSMRKSKNRYFYHIFVFVGDAPGAITLNVVWIERESNAYKLSRCMCPSNYNRFWDRARYLWKKLSFYYTPLHSTPPLGGFPSEYRHPVWYGKTRMVWLPEVKKIEDIYNGLDTIPACDRQTDGQTDRHLATALRYCAMHTRRAIIKN